MNRKTGKGTNTKVVDLLDSDDDNECSFQQSNVQNYNNSKAYPSTSSSLTQVVKEPIQRKKVNSCKIGTPKSTLIDILPSKKYKLTPISVFHTVESEDSGNPFDKNSDNMENIGKSSTIKKRGPNKRKFLAEDNDYCDSVTNSEKQSTIKKRVPKKRKLPTEDSDSDNDDSIKNTKKRSTTKKRMPTKRKLPAEDSDDDVVVMCEDNETVKPKKRDTKAATKGPKTTKKAKVSSNADNPVVIVAKQTENYMENGTDNDIASLWKDEDMISETCDIPVNIVKNVIKLLNQECTVPFIARYRKEVTENLDVEKIREIETTYETVKTVHKKIVNVVKVLEKSHCDEQTIMDLRNAKTMEEIELLYAPYKPGNKRSFAERAKALGLESVALDILNRKKCLRDMNFDNIVDENEPGKATAKKVVDGIKAIIADTVAKDRVVLDFIRNNKQQQYTNVSCSESAIAKKKEKQANIERKKTQNFKFENYFNFNNSVQNIGAHQVMAINRGESQKVLTVKLRIQPCFRDDIIRKCKERFDVFRRDSETGAFLCDCIEDAYTRLLEPHMFRQIRSELTKKASKESVGVFCSNLKQLLLTPPVRGKTVIGIDPGFTHGCKVAVVSCTGDVLATDVVYLGNFNRMKGSNFEATLIDLVSIHSATLIAVGNGTASRKTENWLSDMIKRKAFQPHDVKYCIVNESGASVYSVTKEAELELPNMDPNLRSAVAIARRLQDPLLEYVKVEPKHLGIGMYQHDISETMLKTALESIVVECVSFVGVDLNVCPHVLLRKISGLSESKVKSIIEWREKNGSFINRKQLLEVKGLGPKSFEQCAGFVKIFPETSIYRNCMPNDKPKASKKSKNIEKMVANLLDATIIHPESYDVAEKFLTFLNARPNDIGQQSLIDMVNDYLKCCTVELTAEILNTSSAKMQLIVDSFKQLMKHDIRAEFDVPLFKTGVQSIKHLKVNEILTGRVMNVTNFGAFVDIGVGNDGLIHVSKMNRMIVELGYRVSVRVISVDIQKKRISLELLKKL